MITLDQIFSRTPINTLAGNEILLLQKSGTTGGTLLSTLKNYLRAGFVANDVTNATTLGKSLMTVADLAAAKNLLEIPVSKTAVTLSANTTLTATHANRRVFVSTGGITLTLNAGVITTADSLTIVNRSNSAITINAGTSEDILVRGGAASTVTTYSLPARSVLRAYLIDSDSWFFEV